jgi:hypothetical protein
MPHVTLIQMGDLHGHLLPRPNLRGDGTGRWKMGWGSAPARGGTSSIMRSPT